VAAVTERSLVAFALAAVALGFAPGGAAEPVRSLLEMRREGVVLQQWDASCGAAALATVLRYTFDEPVTEREAAQAMLRKTDPLRVKVRGGFSLLDMKRFAESRDYRAEGYRGLSMEELLGMRSPIVVIEEFGRPHFVVVRGMRGGEIDIADPAFGNRRMAPQRFREAWRDGIGFVLERQKP
jgi:predicted double-glycine peptidase